MVFAAFITPVLFGTYIASEHPWWNYPGLELWKFINLFLFIFLAWYLHRRFGRPVKEALRARRERIKTELEKARQERDLAYAKLAEVQSRFERLDAEVVSIREKATAEAAAESERIRATTEQEIGRIRDNAKRELESAGKVAKAELRQFAAQESIRLAEGILAREIKPEDDARLTTRNLQELGRPSS